MDHSETEVKKRPILGAHKHNVVAHSFYIDARLAPKVVHAPGECEAPRQGLEDEPIPRILAIRAETYG